MTVVLPKPAGARTRNSLIALAQVTWAMMRERRTSVVRCTTGASFDDGITGDGWREPGVHVEHGGAGPLTVGLLLITIGAFQADVNSSVPTMRWRPTLSYTCLERRPTFWCELTLPCKAVPQVRNS